jgi:DNA-binding SARP family transcriptional activator
LGISGGSVHFGTLGPFEVTVDGRPLDLGRPKQRAVLVELLIHANRVVSLDRFTESLWPDDAGGRSTRSLPVYIANLRRLVEPERPARTPPERILTRVPGYLLHVAPGEYDAADFERMAMEGNRHLADHRPRAARHLLGEALALWRGRALEEFDFAEGEARRLEALRVAATEDRIEADLALGAHTAVVPELEELVRGFGLRERLVGQLMLALYRSGRQSEALRTYTVARDLLAEEVGLEPGPELRRLEADILAQSDALEWRPPPDEGLPPLVRIEAAPAPPAPDPFVGRRAELAALDQARTRLGEGSGGIVLVSGEPGIGKTRLVREAFSHSVAGAWVVAWGCCEEGDGAPPFWPWIQVIRSLLDHPDTGTVRSALGPSAPDLVQLVPEVKRVMGEVRHAPALDPLAARHRFFEAVEGFLERLSHRVPVAVVLDDIHWADPPSVELTGHLARRIPALGALLVAIYRDVDPAPDDRLTGLLAMLARLPGRLDVSLAGLTQDEVAQFVVNQSGAEAPDGVVAAVWARAAGNPFFVGELTRLLVAEKKLTVDAASAAGVPWAVRQVVRRRVARLPAPTRRLLSVAAVAGQDFDLRAVAVAAAVELDVALDLVDVAVAAGVVREEPATAERFRFSHALVQEAIYEEANPLRRARLHGLVADALEAVGGEQAPATEVAHHLYEAVPVIGPSRAVVAAGRASAAAQAALAPDVAEDLLRRALELVATMPPGRERDHHELDIQDRLAALLSLVKGVAVPETAAAWSRATELCREVEDRHRLLRSLWGLLSYAWASGDLEAARTLGEHLLRLGEGSSEPVVTATAYLGLGSVAVCGGELVTGTQHLVAGKRLADGVPEHLLADVTFADLRVQVDSWLALARHLAGKHDDGRRLIEGALSRARTLEGPFTTAIGLAFGIFARVLGGDAPGAREVADELRAHSDLHQLADFAFHARVAQVWTVAQGDFDGPELQAMVEALPPASAAGIRPWRPLWLALIAEVWQRLGRPDEVRRVLDEAFRDVEAMGSSVATPELHRLRGLSAPGGAAEAIADLEEAVRLAAEQGAVVYLERAEAALAEAAPGKAGAGLAVARAPHEPGFRQRRAR